MTLLECIERLNLFWMDDNGLIHTVPVEDGGPTTLNGVLYTGIVYAMVERAAEKQGLRNHPLVVQFLVDMQQAIHECLEPRYPMVCRTKTNRDQEGPDDYKGLAAWCAFSPNGKLVAENLLEYGDRVSQTFRWFKCGRWLNNSDRPTNYENITGASFLTKLLYWPLAPWGYRPWVQPWMGRFPAITFSFRQVADQKPGIIPTLFAAGSLLTQGLFGNKEKPDHWYMDWTIIAVNEKANSKSRLVALASKLWYRKLRKLYPNGMRDVWAQYVGQYNEDFPLNHFFEE